MNHDMPHIDNDAVEREWQAQERARLQVNAGRGAGEGGVEPYRLIAEALRAPLPAQLPSDFAEVTARRAGVADAGRLERYLVRALVACFGLAAALVVVLYGRQWWQPLSQGPLVQWLLNPWLAVLLVCLGLSGVAGLWQPVPGRSGWKHAGTA